MASISSSSGLAVYKFKTTGIVALCEEVTDFVRSGDAERFGVDLDSARFVENDDTFLIKFDFLPKEVP